MLIYWNLILASIYYKCLATKMSEFYWIGNNSFVDLKFSVSDRQKKKNWKLSINVMDNNLWRNKIFSFFFFFYTLQIAEQ